MFQMLKRKDGEAETENVQAKVRKTPREQDSAKSQSFILTCGTSCLISHITDILLINCLLIYFWDTVCVWESGGGDLLPVQVLN